MKGYWYKQLVLVLVLLFLCLEGYAQLQNPELICVKKENNVDSLTFDLPAIGCGNVLDIRIYVSLSLGGPYTLDTVIDPNLQNITLPNMDNDVRFYYITYNTDCPEGESTSSDTLNNEQRPPNVDFYSVSVNANGDVVLTWEDISSNPKVRGYQIDRTDNNTSPIATIPIPDTTYIDNAADPENRAINYRIRSIDGCLTSSNNSGFHRTIWLTNSISECDRLAELSWTPYVGWGDDEIEYYIVYVSENGGAAEALDTVPSDQLSAVINVDDENTVYEVYIEAKQMNRKVFSRSNTLSFQPEIIQGLNNFRLLAVSQGASGLIPIWIWNTDATVISAEAQQIGGDSYSIFDGNPLEVFNQRTIAAAGGETQAVFLRATDSCQTVALTDTQFTAFIRVSPNANFENQVDIFYPSVANIVNVQSCELVKLAGDVEVGNISLNGEDQVLDPISSNLGPESTICYQLRCQANTVVDGSSFDFEIQSNVACPEYNVEIQVPNAIVPTGVNSTFRPLILFENLIADYKLTVFDRYGQEVFVSEEPSEGWNGNQNGDLAAMGVYVYLIEITQTDGNTEVWRGNFMLVR